MNTGRSNKFAFSQNHHLSFIQDFVNTKVHNPDLIQQLKLKQIKKFELQKAKLRQESLLIQLQKSHHNLSEAKKVHVELKHQSLTKDQEAFNIQEKTIQMDQKIDEILIPSNDCKTQQKSQKHLKIEELKSLTQLSMKSLQDEEQNFKASLENIKFKLSTVLEKKLKLNESLLSLQNQVKTKKSRKDALNGQISQKRKLLQKLEQKKIKISQRKSSKLRFKDQTLKNLKTEFSQNTKSEEECVLKLVKFVKELNQIVEDPKSQLQEKKNMISLMLNVYCRDEKVHEKARAISIEIEDDKQKHDSIQTGISLQNGSQSSMKQIKKENEGNGPQIPLLLLHTLQQTANKYGLKQEPKDYRFEQPVMIRKKSTNEQTQIKSRLSKLNRRDSLPMSLNEKDLQNQFITYCQNQLNDLQASERILDQKQGKIQKQILLLIKKCSQKDAEIQSILEQNRKSYPKS